MDALIRFRKESGLSQSELAERIGTSPGYLHDIENGRRKPSAKLARHIEAVTGVPRAILLPEVFGPPQAIRSA